MQPISEYIPDAKSSLVYVGSRDVWDKSNPFRKAFGIERLPTIVKITDSFHSLTSQEIPAASKLVEADVYNIEKLKAFLSL